MVRHSGEIPEIAYNSAIYHLTIVEDGPLMFLDEDQVDRLQKAALERYREIVIRDIIHENVKKTTYRGVKRTIQNYQRLCDFCSRQQLDFLEIRVEAARLLPLFLETAMSGGDESFSINCTFSELQKFADELQVQLPYHPIKIKYFCQD